MSTLKSIVRPLVSWYKENKRPLPWRKDREPYHVWISEIMLQQTRIEAVKKYYVRFLEALPDVRNLSEVDDDALLKLWEGLGYYSRARNLKKAAITITTEYGGSFPSSYDELRKLSGIGDYTAAAIASICFGEKVPAVDGNVLRVVARIQKSRENVLLPETKKRVFRELSAIMPEEAGEFNEALMELGEVVCLPGGIPDCGRCPISAYCAAYREHLTEEIPVRVKQQKRKIIDKSVFLIRTPDRRIAIEKRNDDGLLSGMYQLPNVDGVYTDSERMNILKGWELSPKKVEYFKKSKHIFTHMEWHMSCLLVDVSEKNERFLWVTPKELLRTYPLPTAFSKLLKGAL